MNPELPNNPREELELRVTALLLGELSADEAAAVREAVAKDPELTRLHDDLNQTIHLVRQATTNAGESVTEQAAPPTLSEARRKKLLTHFAIPPLKESDRKPKPLFRLRLVEWAAVLTIIVAVIAVAVVPLGVVQREHSEVSATTEETVSRADILAKIRGVSDPGSNKLYSLNVVGYHNVPITGLPSVNLDGAAGLPPASQPSTSVALPMARNSPEQAGTPLATPPPEASVAALAPTAPVLAARQSQIALPSLPDTDGDGKAKDEMLRESGSTSLFVGDPEFIGLLRKNSRNATSTTGSSVSQDGWTSGHAGIADRNVFAFQLPTDEKSKAPEGGQASLANPDASRILPPPKTDSLRESNFEPIGRAPVTKDFSGGTFLGEVAVAEGNRGGGGTGGGGAGGLRFFTNTSFDAAGAVSTPLPMGGNSVALDSFSVVPDTPAIDPSTGLPMKVESGLERADGGVSTTRRLNRPGVVALTDSPVANSGFLALDETRRLGEVDRDKASVLGNLPNVGTLFRSEQNRPHGTTVVGLNYDANTYYRQPAKLGVEEFGRASTNVVLYAESPAANTSLADLIRGPSVRPQSTIVSNGQTWEFAGYDLPGQFIPQGQSVSGNGGTDFSIQAQLPVARYRLKQAVPSAAPQSGELVGERAGVISQTAPVTPLKPAQQQLDGATQEKLAGSLGEAKLSENFGAIILPATPEDKEQLAEAKNSKLAAVPSRLLRLPVGERAEERETLEKKTASVPKNVPALVQEGKQLLEAGRIAEAEEELKAALRLDPENQPAFYYWSFIKEARYGQADRLREQHSKDSAIQVEQNWSSADFKSQLPVPNSFATNTLIWTNSGRQAIVSKLNSTKLHSVLYDGLPLSEVVRTLSDETKKRDPLKKGLNFVINPNSQVAAAPAGPTTIDPSTGLPLAAPPQEAVDVGSIPVKINPALNDMRLADVLDIIVKVADRPIKYSIEDWGIMFSLAGNEDRPALRKPSTSAAIPQPEIQTSENNFSTFSLNVSDVSFKLTAASLEKGQMPDAASVRSEEFINAFDYRDPEPAAGVPIAFAWERARYPFAHNRDLLRFSLKTAAAGRQAGRPLNVVLLLDNSGSMERADRVSIIREALRVLASQLQPQDKLSVITFARTARLVADGISGDKAGEVAEQVSGRPPQGGTNLEDAMHLAYQTAARHYLANGINRVVLLTDGAANLGDVEPESLKQKVEAQRKQGIALDCFGIGWEGLNDDLLEVLSRNGDGRYGFINSPEEAATDFAGQLAGALKVAASDVKVQVEFNPKRVTAYRQIGYAKHQLTKEQFRDNTVDAAEIAAQETGNALYTVEVNSAGEGPLGTVRVRYKIPGTTDYREQAWDVPYNGNAASLEQSSPAMRLAATASAFSEWLVASPFAGEVTPDRLLGYLSGVPEVYGADSRPKKLEWMIRQTKSIAGKQ